MDPLAALRRDVDDLDEMLRGDGNGKIGIAARLRKIEDRHPEVLTMLKEWTSVKQQLRGARLTLVAVAVILGVLGGGLGVAILRALSEIASALP